MSEVRVVGLSYRLASSQDRAETVLFHDLDLLARDGQITVIIGPSGCGKSSLLNIISSLTPPHAGQVLLDGEALDVERTPIAYIFQESTLFPWLTAIENVAYGADQHRRRGFEVLSPQEQRSMLEALGFAAADLEKYPHELSGGMKQRVELARALAYRPKLLLMDEPFRSLDAQTRKVAQEVLYATWKLHRPTIVLVTHSVIEAAFLGHRTIVLTAKLKDAPTTIKTQIEGMGPDIARDYLDTYTEQPFMEVRKRILAQLQDEVIKSTGVAAA